MRVVVFLLSAVFAAITGPACTASIIVFTASLSGPAEAPSNASPGTGSAQVKFDTVMNMMRVQSTFSGLLGTTTAAHIHAATAVAGTGTAGVATQTPSFLGFPLAVTAGSMDTTFDMTLASSYRAGFIAANGGTTASARAALLTAMIDGKSYFNIHTTIFPGGEIRGFLTAIPEPNHVLVLGVCALGAYLTRRLRQRRSAAPEV